MAVDGCSAVTRWLPWRTTKGARRSSATTSGLCWFAAKRLSAATHRLTPRLVEVSEGFNNHLLASREEARTSEPEFNFQVDGGGRSLPSVVFRLMPQDFFVTNPQLDYTLVAVAERAPDGTALRDFGWNRLVEETRNRSD